MNEAQKKIMIAVAIGLVITFLFPPHAIFLTNGNAIKMGYAFIANIPYGYSMHMLMLLAEWLGIVMLGGIAYFIAQNTQNEYTSLQQSNGSNNTKTVQSSTSDVTNKHKRWMIRIIGFIVISTIYFLWLMADVMVAGPGPHSPILKNLLLVISIGWIIKFSNEKSVDKELKSETHPKKNNISNMEWLFIIIVVVVSIWAAMNKENKNTLPVSTTPTIPIQVQTQPVQAPQSTTSSTNSANDIALRANDLYSQGRYAEALPLVLQLAEQNHVSWQLRLGYMYNQGQGAAQDNNLVFYWYKKAAEQGDSDGQYNLGYLYETGLGVVQDYSQAAYWYKKAAEQGNANAKAALEKVLGKEKMAVPYQVQTQPVQTQQTKQSIVKKIKKANKNRGDLRHCLSLGSNEAIAQCAGQN